MQFTFDSSNTAELRAIHAAVTALLGGSVEVAAPAAAPAPVPMPTLAEHTHVGGEAEILSVGTVYAEELDSQGQPWNAELHASTKTKTQDGVWKKRRGAEAVATPVPPAPVAAVAAPVPAAPAPTPAPVPAAPAPAAELVTMNQIWALASSGKATIDQIMEVGREFGFADLGKMAQGSTNEQRAEVLRRFGA